MIFLICHAEILSRNSKTCIHVMKFLKCHEISLICKKFITGCNEILVARRQVANKTKFIET